MTGVGSPAWTEGWHAFFEFIAGEGETGCPNYEVGTPEYDDWNAGWDAAEWYYET